MKKILATAALPVLLAAGFTVSLVRAQDDQNLDQQRQGQRTPQHGSDLDQEGEARLDAAKDAEGVAAKGDKKLVPGTPAPEFALRDKDGTEHRLVDMKGKIVVLEWFDPECRSVRKHHIENDTLGELRQRFQGDVEFLAVYSEASLARESIGQVDTGDALEQGSRTKSGELEPGQGGEMKSGQDEGLGGEQDFGGEQDPNAGEGAEGDDVIIVLVPEEETGQSQQELGESKQDELGQGQEQDSFGEPKQDELGQEQDSFGEPKQDELGQGQDSFGEPKQDELGQGQEQDPFAPRDELGQGEYDQPQDEFGQESELGQDSGQTEGQLGEPKQDAFGQTKHGQQGQQKPGEMGMAKDCSFDEIVQRLDEGLREYSIDYPILIDDNNNVARMYDVKTTPTIVIIDREGNVAYTGAIDDNAGRERGQVNYVAQALEQLVAGQNVTVAETEAYGCKLNVDGGSGSKSGEELPGELQERDDSTFPGQERDPFTPGMDPEMPETPGTTPEMPGSEFPGGESELPGDEFPGGESELPGDEFPGGESELPGDEFPGDESELPGDEFPGDESDIPGDTGGETGDDAGGDFPR